jgi:hypothetical protein
MELIKSILHEYKCGIAITKFNINLKLNNKFDDELQVFINTFNNMNQKYSCLMDISKDENQNILRSSIEELKSNLSQFLKFSEAVNQEATKIDLPNKSSTNDNDDYILLFKNILVKIRELKNHIFLYFTNQFNEKPYNNINKQLNDFIEVFKFSPGHFAEHTNVSENDYYNFFYQQLLILLVKDNNINNGSNNNNNNNNNTNINNINDNNINNGDNNDDDNDKIMVVNHSNSQQNLSPPPLDEFSLILKWEKLLFFYNNIKSVIKKRQECLSSLLIIPRSVYQKNPALKFCHSNVMDDDANDDYDNVLLKDDNDHLVNEEEKTDYLNPIYISEDISNGNLLTFTLLIDTQYVLFKNKIGQIITQHQWHDNQNVPFLNEKLIEFKRFRTMGNEFYNFDKVTDATELLLPNNDLDDLSQHALFTKKYHNNLLKCINQQENNQEHAHLHSSEQINFIKLVAKYNQLMLFHTYLERMIVDDENKKREYCLSLEPKMPLLHP